MTRNDPHPTPDWAETSSSSAGMDGEVKGGVFDDLTHVLYKTTHLCPKRSHTRCELG